MLSGLKKNEKELALPVKIAEFAKLLDDARAEDKVQEELKAKTQESTVRLNKLMKDLKDNSARIISSLQGQYGKKNEKLEEFGIKPLKSGRRKPAVKQQVCH
ncbi:hypothetical protein HY768_10110 [candidate division TA06 bacterium]|uniref:Uncharacterized protein n=1 Tax=candidate division TA06 bacterium TaxID=2250710 RepID=A0A933MKB9_UNCT6|nr:hypothetical protein [candidate division TA06 bacterium]